MENKIVTFLLAILLALGGWNLSQTFKLSNDMVLVKEKISNDKVCTNSSSLYLLWTSSLYFTKSNALRIY